LKAGRGRGERITPVAVYLAGERPNVGVTSYKSQGLAEWWTARGCGIIVGLLPTEFTINKCGRIEVHLGLRVARFSVEIFLMWRSKFLGNCFHILWGH
jgi:hypothetical protein